MYRIELDANGYILCPNRHMINIIVDALTSQGYIRRGKFAITDLDTQERLILYQGKLHKMKDNTLTEVW